MPMLQLVVSGAFAVISSASSAPPARSSMVVSATISQRSVYTLPYSTCCEPITNFIFFRRRQPQLTLFAVPPKSHLKGSFYLAHHGSSINAATTLSIWRFISSLVYFFLNPTNTCQKASSFKSPKK